MSGLLSNALHRLGLGASDAQNDPSSVGGAASSVGAHGAEVRKPSHLDSQDVMTTETGCPVSNNKLSMRAGHDGPILMQDVFLIDKLARFNRERVPERVVHAHGAGAHGYFQVTKDISKYTKADFLQPGQKTPVFVRFSSVRGANESSDSNRDPRGFSIKHYTNEGIWDAVNNNTPIFFMRDPAQFVDFIHCLKPDPSTGMPNMDTLFDWSSCTPESIHQMLWLWGPRGLPASYAQIQGYISHTLKFVNKEGEHFWVKVHYLSDQGVKTLTQKEADGKQDPTYLTRDLQDRLQRKENVSWTMYIQVIPPQDVAKYKWNIFDLTKVVPHKDYPLQEVGKLHLTHNPTNYFAEVEQAAFSPGNMVPGIEASPDPMLQARLWSYQDTQRYRLGVNYNTLPINCPFNKVRNNDSDGAMQMCVKQGANFHPNKTQHEIGNYNGGCPSAKFNESKVHLKPGTTTAERFDWDHPNSDFEQPQALWRKVFSDADRDLTVHNFATALKTVKPQTFERFTALLAKVDETLAKRVREATDKLPMSESLRH